MENILIIKTNASGDVLRTTVLLHILKGNIYWITASYNIPLFPDHFPGLTLIPFENIPAELFEFQFDIIINLEEDLRLAQMVSTIQTNKIIGVYLNNDKLDYSPESAEWFDMSLISKLSVSGADALKRNNNHSFQEILYRMLGKSFLGQKYVIHRNNFLDRIDPVKLGIEKRVGNTWPNKKWHGYEELEKILRNENYSIKILSERNQLRQYMEEIDQCAIILSGDTLAMHIAIAYEIPCIAIFNCTSPHEIYDYGILKKLLSPLLHQAFYKRERFDEIINSIAIQQVYKEVKKEIQNMP